MKLIKRLKEKWQAYKVKAIYVDAKSEQVQKEVQCTLYGHVWKGHKFDPKIVNSKVIQDRRYCTRCKVMYHVHTYKK